MMKIVGISGWLQPADALQALMPEMESLAYSDLPNIRRVAQALSAMNPEVVIGWSLGGVLAVQSLLHPGYRPKKLVLLATPFQYVHSETVPEGITTTEYTAFRRNFMDDAKRASRRLQLLMNQGMEPGFPLCAAAENYIDKKAWLPWLEHLGASSFEHAVFPHQPEVLVIQGGLDKVVDPAQAKHWQQVFPKAQILMLPHASHAPHWQAAEFVQHAIAEFIHGNEASVLQAAYR